MLAKAHSLFKAYHREMDSVNSDFKESVQDTMKREINGKYAKDVGQVRTNLEVEAERLHSELEAAQNPVTQLARLAVDHADNVPPGVMGIISSLPGLPDEVLGVLADRAKNPVLQLGIYSRVALKDGDKAASLRARVLSRVAMPVDQIQSLARQEKEHWQALFAGADIPGEASSAKLHYGHQIAALDKVLAG